MFYENVQWAIACCWWWSWFCLFFCIILRQKRPTNNQLMHIAKLFSKSKYLWFIRFPWPLHRQTKTNLILFWVTVTVINVWNLTCKLYDGFGASDLVPGSVFSNEKSPSLSNHSGSYQNHPPSCPPLTELSWSDLRLSTGFPKTGTFWFQVAPIPFCFEHVVIPDICHERHEYIRVNFFWLV